MDSASARKWVVISALVVAGVWGYRHVRQSASDPAEAGKTMLAFPEFITAWGAVYFTLAMIAEATPRFAGAMAILIMTADGLTQGKQVIADVTSEQKGSKPAAKTPAPKAAVGAHG